MSSNQSLPRHSKQILKSRVVYIQNEGTWYEQKLWFVFVPKSKVHETLFAGLNAEKLTLPLQMFCPCLSCIEIKSFLAGDASTLSMHLPFCKVNFHTAPHLTKRPMSNQHVQTCQIVYGGERFGT